MTTRPGSMSEKDAWRIGGAGVVNADTLRRYARAGFGGTAGLGSDPALLVIDVQYRTTGTRPQPLDDAVEEFSISCGQAAWDAVVNIEKLLTEFRDASWPVLFPHVAPKKSYDSGRLSAKVPAIMEVPAYGYDFVKEVAPADGDILLPKHHPSAFFGTPLTSYLVDAGVDTLIVTGCTTSGCVRASVVDAFSYNFHVSVPGDAVYDRSPVVHEVSLFDMAQKYADVTTTNALVNRLRELRTVQAPAGSSPAERDSSAPPSKRKEIPWKSQA